MRFVTKDNQTYVFDSKYEFLNNPYAINNAIKKSIDKKINDNMEFLQNSYVEINGKKMLSLYDLTITANYQPKVFKAELWNRIETMRQLAKELKFDTPVFITLTPPSELKPLKQIKLKKYIKLVDNPKFNNDPNYVKASKDFISQRWRKFLSQKIFKNIREKYNNQNMIYLKVFEPFLDGSAHCHIVCFIPNEFKDRFVKLVKGYFKTKTDVKTEFNGDIGGVVAYLLKYALKTFKNSENNKLEDVAYWYIFYGIRRFTTSRSLCPLCIYRKIKHDEDCKNLKNMTNTYKKGYMELEVLSDYKKVLSGEKMHKKDYKLYSIFVGFVDEENIITYRLIYRKSLKVRLILFNKEENKNIKKFDYLSFELNNSSFVNEFKFGIKRMKAYKLLEYYQSFQKKYSKNNPYYFIVYYPFLLAYIENELFKKGFSYFTKQKYLHDLSEENEDFLRVYFALKFFDRLPYSCLACDDNHSYEILKKSFNNLGYEYESFKDGNEF